MREKLNLQQGWTLQNVGSRSKGFMAETDINEYSILNEAGEIVGSVVHTDHTAVRGLKRTQTVLQKDIDGNVIVDVRW